MPKNKTDEVFDSFVSEVLSVVSEDQRAAIESKIRATKARDMVLAREDYSRSQDALRDERTKFEADLVEVRKKVADWQAYVAKKEGEAEVATKKVAVYEEQYGAIDDQEPKTKFVRAEDFDDRLRKEIASRDAAAIQFANDLTDIKLDHFSRFKEKLDTRAMLKMAEERQLPLLAAYDAFTADRVEALRKTELDDAIKRARDEGFKEALSKHHLPIVTGPVETHVLDAPKETPRTAHDRIAAAVADWNERARSA